MLEHEWLECTDPQRMLDFLQDKTSLRRLRLLACACLRGVWNLLDEDCRSFVELVERNPDSTQELAHWIESAMRHRLQGKRASHVLEFETPPLWHIATALISGQPRDIKNLITSAADLRHAEVNDTSAARRAAVGNELQAVRAAWAKAEAAKKSELIRQCALVREIFGHAFKPVAFHTSCLSFDAVNLAQKIYDDRAFDRMPILADALMDAGCDNGEIIAHCRGNGPHARGCWVVDLLLGKE